MLTLKEIKTLHDKAYNYNTITRERAADDSVFAWVTQWDDALLGQSQLAYRGEFNILRKATRQIMADLRSNPVQVDFEPKADSRDDGADLIDGLYLADDRQNTSIESYDNATGEAVVCGIGGWELYTEYESNRAGNENQVIKRRPLYEYNNTVFQDPNAKLLDKSDSKYCSILKAYSEDGYKDLVHELTGEEIETINPSNFADPEQSYTFPWIQGASHQINVVNFYHKEQVKDKILNMLDPLGQPLMLRESDLEEVMDDLIDEGYTIDSERTIKRWQVTKYIASGENILSHDVIAGENIPVVPTYGERAFVEGEEHYEGVVRLAKDPQRLRNFQLSYMADIVSRSPRSKPIFTPEQIQGFEFMYEEAGADNNYPYLLQQSKDAAGNPLPIGPLAVMPEQSIPSGLLQMDAMTRQAVDDVANAGLPQDIADPDVSGKAVMALQNRLDQQSIVYQQNLKHAKRRDGEIYASMATEVYDSPRQATIIKPDGTKEKVSVMDTVIDKESGDTVTLNDLTNMEFSVYADIGPSYASKREQTLETLGGIGASVAMTDPALHKMIILKQLGLVEGVNMDDIREYANKQLILGGFKAPETEEEISLLQEAQSQPKEPDAAMMLAMAEDKKGQASLAESQRKAVADEYKAQTDQGKLRVDEFRAQTDRAAVQVDAQEAGANIEFTKIKASGQQIDNMVKMTAPFRASVAKNNSGQFSYNPQTGSLDASG